MEFRVIVIWSYVVTDPKTRSFTTHTKSESFTCLNEALDSIRSFDYPTTKISIHLLTH